MLGTRIVIEATSPLAFSTEAEKEGYVAMVTRTVQAHGATDVTVTVGDQVEWLSPFGAPAPAVESTES